MQPMPEDWERAVAVVAHPDDLEYGAASAVARWTAQGKQVSYVLASRGEAGIAGMDPAVVGPLRVEEERARAALVGVTTVEFLDHADGADRVRPAPAPGPGRRLPAPAPRRRHHHELRPDLGRGRPGQPLRPPRRRPGRPGRLPRRGQRVGLPRRRPRCDTIKDAYVMATGSPTHFVDVTGTIDAGIASLRAHQAYIDGLGRRLRPGRVPPQHGGLHRPRRGRGIRGRPAPLPHGMRCSGLSAGKQTWPWSMRFPGRQRYVSSG